MRVQLWMRRSDGQTRRSWFWCAWKTVPNNFRLIWRFLLHYRAVRNLDVSRRMSRGRPVRAVPGMRDLSRFRVGFCNGAQRRRRRHLPITKEVRIDILNQYRKQSVKSKI